MCEINSQAIQDVTDRNSLFSAEIQKNRILKVNGQNYNYFQSRKISGKIKTITIKRDSLGDFYIFVVTDAEIFKVDRYFASSQICNQCGEKNSVVKDLKIREGICPKCGEKHAEKNTTGT